MKTLTLSKAIAANVAGHIILGLGAGLLAGGLLLMAIDVGKKEYDKRRTA